MEGQCILWDKTSMSCCRILKLANFLHYVLAKEGESLKPFGGKQLITIGEFLQLPPVPNLFDKGRYMFKSSLWRKILPHQYDQKITLTNTVKRIKSCCFSHEHLVLEVSWNFFGVSGGIKACIYLQFLGFPKNYSLDRSLFI